MNRKLSRKRNSRRQRGGCGLKPLSPAAIDMGPLTGGRKRRRTNKRKSKRGKRGKKGGNVGALAAAGLLGTLLAFGSKKHKSKGKRTRRRRSSKRR